MKYVILLADTEAGLRVEGAERDAWFSEIMNWYEKTGASGKLADGGHKLQPVNTAKTIRSTGVFDGPYMEAKEILGGFSVLETDTIDEAVEIAQTWPGVERGWMTIEVRPVVVFD
jgi:hypothetical protein